MGLEKREWEKELRERRMGRGKKQERQKEGVRLERLGSQHGHKNADVWLCEQGRPASSQDQCLLYTPVTPCLILRLQESRPEPRGSRGISGVF